MSLISNLPVGAKYDSAVIGIPRRKVFTNGISRPFISDGISVHDLGIDPPPLAPTDSGVRPAGSLTPNSTYRFVFVYRRDLNATVGNPSPSVTITIGAGVTGIRLNIPADPHFQVGLDRIEVYRTLAGGTMLFFEGSIAYTGVATTFDSVRSDLSLGIPVSMDNAPPPVRPFVISAFNQLTFWGSVTHSAGTVAVTNGSAIVTGTGTGWLRAMRNKAFKREGDTRFYVISSVDSATQITLTVPYVGTTATGVRYTISLPPNIAEWSHIDSRGNVKFESFPTDNYDIFEGGQDNEKATGLGTVTNGILLFTNFSSWIQNRIGANTRTKQLLSPGIGCINYKTICNDTESGDCMWLDQSFNIRRSNGSPGGAHNLTQHFIASILNGTHTGIHRNLRHNTARVNMAHAIFYPEKSYLMLFFVLGTTAIYPNACFVCDMKINPIGSREAPSPWMLWTGFTAVCSALLPDANGVLRPSFGDDLGFVWQMDSGTNDGVPSGTTERIITGITATVLTDTGATFFTTGDGLRGVRLRTLDINGNIRNDRVIQSNTATTLTVTGWDTMPAVGDTYIIGGIPLERFTKDENDGVPSKVKIPHYLNLTYENAGAPRILRVRHYTNASPIPETALGRSVDVGRGIQTKVNITSRGFSNQLKFENFRANQPITLTDWSREVTLGGNK